MSTRRVQVLCEGANEYSPKTPVAVWRGPGTLVRGRPVESLDEETWACLAADDDRPVRVRRWELREVELPDWLDPEEWLADWVGWHWLWSAAREVKAWPEPWQRGLRAILREHRSACLLACVELLKTRNFRSAFRRSLRDQLVAWLETPPEERRYSSPFSRRQWERLLDGHLLHRARHWDAATYASCDRAWSA